MAKMEGSSGKTEKQPHPDQVIDTDLPDNHVNKEAFKALQDAYEGDPEDTDG